MSKEYKVIFESKYGFGDLYIDSTKTGIEGLEHEYSLSVDSFIWYDTLTSAKEYYRKLLNELEEFLTNENLLEPKDKEDINFINQYIYKTYDLGISKDENGWCIEINPPNFYSLNCLLEWFRGVVNQLESVEISDRN